MKVKAPKRRNAINQNNCS